MKFPGKEVLEFRVDGSLVDLNGETSYTLTVTNNHNVSILFKNIMYTLTYTIDDGLGNDVFTFQENYTYNNPDDLVTTGYILAETGITDWTYNGAPFTFDGTYDYLQNITLRKTVAPLNSDKLACDLNYDQMTATITEIDNPADQTVIILPNIYLYGTVEYTIVGFKDFSYLDHLFTNQKKVMLLKMSNTITKIGNFTFAGESKLRHISLSNTLQTIGDDAFYDATGLVEINIPNTVETIGDDAFNGTTSLQTVTFENNSRLLSIGYYAFGYSGITSFKLVNDIDIVDKWIFDYANNLETIEIETDSNKYSLLDGVLFSQNGQTLILYPNGKQIQAMKSLMTQ